MADALHLCELFTQSYYQTSEAPTDKAGWCRVLGVRRYGHRTHKGHGEGSAAQLGAPQTQRQTGD